MSKSKMERARELIKAKRYDEARDILELIDHPTAHKWLARLDEIAPSRKDIPDPDWSKIRSQPPTAAWASEPSRSRRKRKRWHWILIAVMVLIAVCAIGIVITLNYTFSSMPNLALQSRLFGYCMDVYIEVGSLEDADIETCREWYPSAYEAYESKVIACDKLSPELDRPFMECLLSEDILPDGIYRTR